MSDRTVPPLLYVLLPYVLVAACVYTFKHAYDHKLWGDAAFAAVNAVLAIYAILAFVGIWKSLCDLAANLASYLHKSDGSKSAPSRAPTPAEVSQMADVHDWEQVPHHGSADSQPTPRQPQRVRLTDRGSALAPRPPRPVHWRGDVLLTGRGAAGR